MEDAGMLAAVASVATACLTWLATRIRASVKQTTEAAAEAVDVGRMREQVDELLEFRESIETERETAERRALEAENAELRQQLEQLEDSATSKAAMRTQPMRRGT